MWFLMFEKKHVSATLHIWKLIGTAVRMGNRSSSGDAVRVGLEILSGPKCRTRWAVFKPNPGWLLCIGDDTTQWYGDRNKLV